MFLRNDQGLEFAGGTSARAFGRASPPVVPPGRFAALHAAAGIDWVPDLGAQIGSGVWWRGLATLTALCAATWGLSPGLDRPLIGAVPAPLIGSDLEEARTQAIAPIALGSTTGRRMAANDLVRPLAEAPERPRIDLSATIGAGDRLTNVLQRAGVGRIDADAAAQLIQEIVPLGDIAQGTRIALTLGRRPDRTVARPLETLELRARFDMAVTIRRGQGGLSMIQRPIAIDSTPLRIRGLVGSSLYRSARAAGAPAKIVEAYLKALATRLSVGRDIRAADGFDLIAEQDRAATGETRIGKLLFAGLDQGRKTTRLVRFDADGKGGDWYDAKGQSERRGFMGMPVAGRITSSFGMRMHPLLGFMRMHKGIDIGAAYGSPIYAVLDGVVSFAGRSGGYGNFVKLGHAGGLASGYGHMSRIAVRPGTRVHQGQVIGYVGSTGMSTGPHLHWEIWRNGNSVNPRSLSFDSVARLSGEKLRSFKLTVARLLAVKSGSR